MNAEPSSPALRSAPPVRPTPVLHVVHGWPPYNHAGVEHYAWSLAVRQAARREVAAYARVSDPERDDGDALELVDRGGVRVRLVVNDFEARNPLVRNGIAAPRLERDFGRYLGAVRPELVHVHHLAGLSAGLPEVVARRGIPMVYHLHDWWTACTRANLLDAERRLCPGPAPRRCAACAKLTGLPPADVWNPVLHALRGVAVRRGLRRAASVVVGTPTLERSLRALGAVPDDVPVRVVPYGVAVDGASGCRAAASPDRRGPLRVGLIGSMMPHKGVHVAAGVFRDVDPARARLDVWGAASALPGYTDEVRRAAGDGPVHLRERFPESEKRAIFASLDVLIVPSLGLESFGLVVDEAFACGVPVIAARRGALAERLAGCPAAALYDPERPEELRAWIERLATDHALLAEMRRRVPPVRTMGEHAAEIEEVYARVLGAERA